MQTIEAEQILEQGERVAKARTGELLLADVERRTLLAQAERFVTVVELAEEYPGRDWDQSMKTFGWRKPLWEQPPRERLEVVQRGLQVATVLEVLEQ